MDESQKKIRSWPEVNANRIFNPEALKSDDPRSKDTFHRAETIASLANSRETSERINATLKWEDTESD